jgi:cytochrome c-type biogenesis protein CcmH
LRFKQPIFLLLFFLSIFIFLPHMQAGAEGKENKYDYKSPEFKAVASQFMCTCGCGQDHYACDMAGCKNTEAFKRDLLSMMMDGKTKDEIREYYVNTLGEEILTAPEKKGFSLLAWVLPFAAIGGAGTGIFFVIHRWVRRRNESPNIERTVESEDEVEREIISSIIEEERKKYL